MLLLLLLLLLPLLLVTWLAQERVQEATGFLRNRAAGLKACNVWPRNRAAGFKACTVWPHNRLPERLCRRRPERSSISLPAGISVVPVWPS